jgi:hypothetical protein
MKNLLTVFACLILNSSLSAINSNLEYNNPFLPQGYNDRTKVLKPVLQVDGNLSREFEFRGVFQINNVYSISIFDKKINRSYWIVENKTENGITVSDFDLSRMRITLSQNGRTEQINLVTAIDSPLPLTAPIVSSNANQLNQIINRRRVVLPKI